MGLAAFVAATSACSEHLSKKARSEATEAGSAIPPPEEPPHSTEPKMDAGEGGVTTAVYGKIHAFVGARGNGDGGGGDEGGAALAVLIGGYDSESNDPDNS